MTNDPPPFRRLPGRQCEGGHAHHHLEGGRITNTSRTYPPKLRQAFAESVPTSIEEQESHFTFEEM
eukprot:4411736-Pyramimonas_sp.AAC.1